MKKVLFVATVSGHIKAFHLPYLELFKQNGYSTFVSSNFNGKDGEQLEFVDKFYQIPIQRSPFSFKNILAIRELKKIILEEKFEIIHCHTPMGGVVARLAAKKARKKYGTNVIYTAHGFHFFKGAPILNWILFYPVEWYLSKYTDTLITINKEDYNFAINKFKKRCNNIKYVPGVGVNKIKFKMDYLSNEKKNIKKSLGLNSDAIVLSCIARLDRNKNQIFLIECMKYIVNSNPNVHLLLVGNDELDGLCEKMVNTYNLQNNIHFLGFRKDIDKILSISNIVVSASKREGLPVNIIEAFCYGIPVVVLKCRGMEDLVVNERNGFIVYDNSPTEFSKCIERIINDKQLNRTFSKNNLKDSEKFLLDNVKDQYKKIYKL